MKKITIPVTFGFTKSLPDNLCQGEKKIRKVIETALVWGRRVRGARKWVDLTGRLEKETKERLN